MEAPNRDEQVFERAALNLLKKSAGVGTIVRIVGPVECFHILFDPVFLAAERPRFC